MSRIVVEMTSDEAGLFRAMGRIIGKQREMETGFGKIAKKSREAGKEQSESFGAKRLGELKAYAAGFVTVQAAIAGVTSAFREMSRVREEAGRRLSDSIPGFGELFQLTPNAGPLIENAKEIRRRAAASTDEEAAGIEFALQSASAEDFRETAIEIGRTKLFRDVKRLIESAEALQTAFGDAETGSHRAIVSKAIGAGNIAPDSAEDVLAGASRAAATGAALGLSDEEVLAATAVVSKPFGSSDIAGTFLNSLFTSLLEQGIKGDSLKDVIGQMQAKDLDFPALKEAFGRTEAIKAFDVLTKQGAMLDQSLADVIAAEQSDLVGRHLQAAAQHPDIAADLRHREAIAERESLEGSLARANRLQEAVQEAQLSNVLRESGDGFGGQFKSMLMRAGGNVGQFFGDEWMLRAQRFTGALDEMPPQLRQDVEAFLDERDGRGPAANHGAMAAPIRIQAESPETVGLLSQIAGTLQSIANQNNSGRTPPAPSLRRHQLAERLSDVS